VKEQAIVYVVDDDGAMLQSVQWLIESAGLSVKAYSKAKDFLADYDPKVVGCLVSDIRMPDIDGLELQEQLIQKNINIPIIFITGHGEVPMAIRAMKAGAIEFLTKPFNDQILLDTIQRGIKKDIEQHKNQDSRGKIASRIERLTPREREVMKLVVAGKLNKVIAGELNISAKTVELHRAKIMEKMEAKSLAELVKLFMSYYSTAESVYECA
jgi:two-component system response regulator FixJ